MCTSRCRLHHAGEGTLQRGQGGAASCVRPAHPCASHLSPLAPSTPHWWLPPGPPCAALPPSIMWGNCGGVADQGGLIAGDGACIVYGHGSHRVLACLPVKASPGSQCVLLAHHSLPSILLCMAAANGTLPLKGTAAAAAPQHPHSAVQRRAPRPQTAPDDIPCGNQDGPHQPCGVV
jgi:hypothetical protein